jgi:hypothetical protein
MVWMSFRRKRSTAALITPSIPTAISASSRCRGGSKKSGHGCTDEYVCRPGAWQTTA